MRAPKLRPKRTRDASDDADTDSAVGEGSTAPSSNPNPAGLVALEDLPPTRAIRGTKKMKIPARAPVLVGHDGRTYVQLATPGSPLVDPLRKGASRDSGPGTGTPREGSVEERDDENPQVASTSQDDFDPSAITVTYIGGTPWQ